MLMIINLFKFASVYVLRTSTVILVSDNILDLELNRRGSMVKNRLKIIDLIASASKS